MYRRLFNKPLCHLLWELLPRHAGLEAVPEINVQKLPAVPVKHQVGGVAVAEA